MIDPVELMGAGLRTGAATAVIADCDDLVTLSLADGIGAASITVPAYAARHLGAQLVRKAAEVERMSALDGLGPCVPRQPDPNAACPPTG
ncbi:UNVERIFIED_CONTAM: hypothetical protein Q9R58_22290 [Methylobacteriaceae bacterium AG10]|nr:hypothetical protein [Methylobacteriaceae bacterium AG10]